MDRYKTKLITKQFFSLLEKYLKSTQTEINTLIKKRKRKKSFELLKIKWRLDNTLSEITGSKSLESKNYNLNTWCRKLKKQ